jgi:aspartyl-tRNA(Asn)/glutamyl-tRNA(Gln) amidotransferase subunit B
MLETKYKLTVGLEIHAELKTKSKMFCGCGNDADVKEPNINVCPVCMAHPGTLPVVNKEAVKSVLKVGIAIGGEIADFTEFDRKNYFYPDIPKGYQISQYKYPLVKGGSLLGVQITRVHLEEDTARSTHDNGDYSLVDFNRAGVPLMELVTEPVIHSAKEAGNFGRELQLVLQYLGVSNANMEKGEMRVEANVSVSDTDKFGVKCEVKNLNSFRSVERAIEYEYERQTALVEAGDEVVQETRGWDDSKQKTFSQRKKENSHDYRYFPDPDLPKFKLSDLPEFSKENLQKEMPELPNGKRERYTKEFGIKKEDIDFYIGNFEYARIFEEAVKFLNEDKNLIKLLSNYMVSDVKNLIGNDTQKISNKTKQLSEIILMIGSREISSRGAKDILAELALNGGDPKVIAEKKGLFQKSDEGELKKIIEDIVKNNEKVVADYRGGKESSLQFLVGQGMKATKGAGNPEVMKKMIIEMIKTN